MSDTGTRRRWFQMHLSTLLVLVLAAAGLLKLNLIYDEFGYGFSSKSEGINPLPKKGWKYGWPRRCVSQYDYERVKIQYFDAFIDVSVAICALLFIVLVLELLVPMLRGKRAWIRLHWATWILVLLLATGGIGINSSKYNIESGVADISDWCAFGWPLPMRAWCTFMDPPDPEWMARSGYFKWDGVILDVAVLAGIVAVAAKLSEWVISSQRGPEER